MIPTEYSVIGEFVRSYSLAPDYLFGLVTSLLCSPAKLAFMLSLQHSPSPVSIFLHSLFPLPGMHSYIPSAL